MAWSRTVFVVRRPVCRSYDGLRTFAEAGRFCVARGFGEGPFGRAVLPEPKPTGAGCPPANDIQATMSNSSTRFESATSLSHVTASHL